MRAFITVFIFLFFSSGLLAQEDRYCRSTIEVEVILKKIAAPKDSSLTTKKDTATKLSGIVCPGDKYVEYRLMALYSSYQVISFVISSETDDGDIIEANNEGELLMGPAMRILSVRNHNKPLYITCIRAKHTSGIICVLKPLTINPGLP